MKSKDLLLPLPLAALAVLLPFEPMEPLARVLGFQMSHVEVAALALLALAGASCLFHRPGASRRVVIPLGGYAIGFLLVCTLSSVAVEGSPVLPLKFTLRMTAATIALLISSRALSLAPRFEWLLFGFALAGTATAAIALLEAGGWLPIESWIGAFREQSFEVGGRARVAATFAYPNTAGGFLVLAMAPCLSFLVKDDVSLPGRALAWTASLGMFTAVLLTYSRGALLGSLSACSFFWFFMRKRGGSRARSALPSLYGAFVLIAVALFSFEPAYRLRASSEGDRGWYRARIEPVATRLTLDPGELLSTRVRVENEGELTWDSTAEKPFHLGYRWFRFRERDRLDPVPLEGERTALPCPVPPGDGLVLEASIRAPGTPGHYVLIWDMVQEHATWFSDKVGEGSPVTVDVGLTGVAASGTATDTPRAILTAISRKAWRPGRQELWGIALRLFRAHPFLGVGPDNFRWLYGPASGRTDWDTRVYANSLALELLATVGILGFLAFALLVAKAISGLVPLAAGGSVAAAALGASLVGFLAHGLVDYLLAFTPIYLAVFLLLGASSAAISEARR